MTRRKRTRKELVLDALSDHHWHDGYALCAPDVGGSEGLRRLRELRDDGHVIEKRPKPGSDSVWQYRLARREPVALELDLGDTATAPRRRYVDPG